MPENVYVFGHTNPDTDSVCSAICYAELLNTMKNTGKYVAAMPGKANSETEFVLKMFGHDSPEIITSAEGKKVILVDHNEFSQSVRGIEKAEISCVCDHHKINFRYSEPICFRTRPVGSTATIIAGLFFQNNIEPDKNTAGLLLSAILSDTVVFRSATTTKSDRDAAQRLAKPAGVDDIEKLGIDIKKAGASVKGMSAEEIIMRDFKEFDFSGKRIGIGQLEFVEESEIDEIRQMLSESLEKIQQSSSLDLALFMLTNIMENSTELMAAGSTGIAEKAFGKTLSGNSMLLENVMSRKKQIVPALEEACR